jgi:putative flippase GtrA
MKIDKKGVTRFFKYSSVGVSTFLLDLLMLYIFVSFFQINYIIATGLAFLVAVSINYIVSRKLVFNKTETFFTKGYIKFITIATIGVTLTLGGMYILVTIVGIYYLLARCFISALVGMGNYLFNLYYNFKVVGEH